MGAVLATCTLLFGGAAHGAFAQPSRGAADTSVLQTRSGALSQSQIDSVIRAFTAKETEFRRALNEYGFKRDALIQSIGMGGQVSGEYHRVSHFTFDDKANRYEKIDFFPMPSLVDISVTPEDLEDLGGVNPFALEASKLGEYNFKFVGKERIDELDLYVFDVSPNVMPDAKKTKERFFVGRIWVDDHDLQIVKSKGKAVPETKHNKFPVVETYREQIGKYWFPTYAYADDDLIFDNADVHVRMLVRYTDYAPARSTVRITELNEAKPEPEKPEPQSNQPKKKPE